MSRLSLVSAIVVLGCGSDLGAEPTEEPFFPESFESSYTLVRDCRSTIDHGFGNHVRVHASAEAAQPYLDQSWPLPAGSVLVKTIYDDTPDCAGSILGYTAMRKEAAGSPPGADDWRWQETDSARQVLDITPTACVSCHASCTNGRDYTCTDP